MLLVPPLALSDEAWIKKAMAAAEAQRAERVKPSREDRREILRIVCEHIAERRRKVYGGVALDAHLVAGGVPGIYEEGAGELLPDVEFYSPDPVTDVIEICDRLSAAGFAYVQGREAMHMGTFTVSVEFCRFCDVTYMPASVYETLEDGLELDSRILSVRGMHCVSPRWMLIDYLRVLADPLTSHWRLDRACPRFLKLLGLLRRQDVVTEVQVQEEKEVEQDQDELREIVDVLLRRVSMMDTCALAGCQAGRAHGDDNNKKKGMRAHVTVLSVNFEQDVEDIVLFLTPAVVDAGLEVVQRRYHPFLDLLGARVVVSMRDAQTMREVEIATIIESMNRAVPTKVIDVVPPLCQEEEERIPMRVCTVIMCIIVASALSRASAVENVYNDNNSRTCYFDAQVRMFEELLLAGDANWAFSAEDVELIGTSKTLMRVHMEATDRKRLCFGGGAPLWLSYDPKKNKAEAFQGYPFLPQDGQEERQQQEQQPQKRRVPSRKKRYCI